MTIEIRRITPDDWPTLKSVRLAALLDTPSAFGSVHAVEAERADDVWQAHAAAGASGDDRATFLAFHDSEVVGIAGGYREHDRPSTVDLVSMWTSPAVRRTGTGRRLVDTVVDWAAATGADTVELWVTRGNDPAQGLYESMGFAETGDHQAIESDPCRSEIRMRRRL